LQICQATSYRKKEILQGRQVSIFFRESGLAKIRKYEYIDIGKHNVFSE
jgi:hypothetical protein